MKPVLFFLICIVTCFSFAGPLSGSDDVLNACRDYAIIAVASDYRFNSPYMLRQKLRQSLCEGKIVPAGGGHESEQGVLVYSNGEKPDVEKEFAELDELRKVAECGKVNWRPKELSDFDKLLWGLIGAEGREQWNMCIRQSAEGLRALVFERDGHVHYALNYVDKNNTRMLTVNAAPIEGTDCTSRTYRRLSVEVPQSFFDGYNRDWDEAICDSGRKEDLPLRWAPTVTDSRQQSKSSTFYLAAPSKTTFGNQIPLVTGFSTTIDANALNETDLYLDPGQQATVTVSGLWNVWNDPQRWASAEGDAWVTANNRGRGGKNPSWTARNLGWFPDHEGASYPREGGHEGSLIIFLDKRFVREVLPADRVGVNIYRVVITGPGQIGFGANDDDYSDNQGALNAVIEVHGPIHHVHPTPPPPAQQDTCQIPMRQHLACAAAGVRDVTDLGCQAACASPKHSFCREAACDSVSNTFTFSICGCR